MKKNIYMYMYRERNREELPMDRKQRREKDARTHTHTDIQVDISARAHLFSCLRFRRYSAWNRRITSRKKIGFFPKKNNQYNNEIKTIEKARSRARERERKTKRQLLYKKKKER